MRSWAGGGEGGVLSVLQLTSLSLGQNDGLVRGLPQPEKQKIICMIRLSILLNLPAFGEKM